MMDSSIISARGVKFNFVEGERVLCYEPDPTKAKVLYESKVLELVVTKDSKGRKIPEYLVHFQGWNSSWDRCVGEDYVLPDTPENRLLQRRLSHEAAINLKGKKRKKLPAILKDCLTKKRCLESKDKDNSGDSDDRTDTSEDEDAEGGETGSEKDEIEDKNVSFFSQLQLSNCLKEKLEDDCCFISQKNKLIQLPCEPNVISILEGYVKQISVSLLCISPSSNLKGTRQLQEGRLLSKDIVAKLNLCKELVDGLRIFFDFTLPLTLLYRNERQQYEAIDTLILPVSSPSPVPRPPPLLVATNVEENYDENNGSDGLKRKNDFVPWHSFQPLIPPSTSPTSPNQMEPSSISLPVNKSSSLNAFTRPTSPISSNSHCNLSPVNSSSRQNKQRSLACRQSNSATNDASFIPSTRISQSGSSSTSNKNEYKTNSNKQSSLPGRTRTRSQSQSLLKGSLSPTFTNSGEDVGRRVLRSAQKCLSLADMSSPNLIKNEPSDSTSPSDDPSLTPPSGVPSKPIPPKETLIAPSLHYGSPSSQVSASQCSSPPPNLNLNSISSISSSDSSSQSDCTTRLKVNEGARKLSKGNHLRDPSGLLNEVLTWQLLPSSLQQSKPPAPSLVYGAQHFLRLFAKIPEYLERMKIPKRKRIQLLHALKGFLTYLEDKSEELFLASAYKEVEDFHSVLNCKN